MNPDYIKNFSCSIIKNQITQIKSAKHLVRYFFKDNVQIVNKHIKKILNKRCSNVTTKMQIKTAMRDCFTYAWITEKKVVNVGENVEKLEILQ